MSLEQKAVRGLLWSGIQNWGSQAGSLLVFVVLARLLTPEAFGLLALANVFVMLLVIVTDLGFEQTLVQRDKLDPGHSDTAFWVQLGLGAVLAAAVLGAAGQLASLVGQSELEPVLQGLGAVLLIHSFGCLPTAHLKRQLAFRGLATSALLGITMSGVVGIGMAVSGFGVWSLVGQQVTFELVKVLVLWRASDWRPGLQVSRRHLRELLGFGVHVMAFQLLMFAARRVDYFLVGFYLGDLALGFYAVAHRVLQVLMQLLVTTIKSVATSTLSRLQSDTERLRVASARLLKFNALLAFPIYLGTAATAPELVLVLFGAKWVPVTPLVQVLALAGIVWSVSALMESAFLALGKPGQRLMLGSIGAALNVVCCSIAVQWGLTAVASAYVVSQLLAFPFMQRGVDRLTGGSFRATLEAVAAPFLCAVVMAGVVVAIRYLLQGTMAPFALLVGCTAVGAGVYAVAIRLVAPALFREFWQLLSTTLSRRGPRE